jgi:uncharacterized membrane protein YbhN (UPF0104 family)
MIIFVDWDSILIAFASADLFLIILSFAVGSINLLFQFLKWKIICNGYLEVTKNKVILSSLFYGFAAGLLTPMRLGEYVGRALPIKERRKRSVILATGIDKFFFIAAVFVIGVLPAWKYFGGFMSKIEFNLLYLLPLVIAFLIAASILLLKNRGKNSGSEKFTALSDPLKNISLIKKLKPGILIKISLISIFLYLLLIVQFGLLLSAFFETDSLFDYILLGNIILFSKTILSPLSLFDFGLREGLTVYYSSLLGLSTAAAFNASLLLFFINLVIPSLIGLFLYLYRTK